MAMFPCDATGHRYSGPQRTMYPALVDGAMSSRRKLRLCQEHFDSYLGQLEDHCQNSQLEFDEPLLVACALCGARVIDDAAQFFCTAYDHGSERADYWAPVHRACVLSLMADWHLSPSMA